MFDLVENFAKENSDFKKVKDLEERIEDIEQYSRNNCVGILGIPATPSEDVGKAMDMNISDEMVDACHGMGMSRKGKYPPGIIVKFVRCFNKEEFLRRRHVKRTLSTRHIGGADDLPIYINESLSPVQRKLHALARSYHSGFVIERFF